MRQNHAMIMCGRKHTGKSTLANKIAKGYASPDRRVLIINVNGSPAYNEHPTINYSQLARWNGGGIYQFYDRDHDAMFDFLIDHFDPKKKKFNGLIVFEDCTKYIDKVPSKKVKSFLVDHRMWNTDMLFTFHSLALVPPFFWTMTSKVIVLKTQDVMSAKKVNAFADKIPNWPAVYSAYQKVSKSPNDFEHKVVDTLI